jgi:type II secretory pathway component PulJ
MPPVILFAIGAVGVVAAYRWLRAEERKAEALRREAAAEAEAREIETLVEDDPGSGVYRPAQVPTRRA